LFLFDSFETKVIQQETSSATGEIKKAVRVNAKNVLDNFVKVNAKLKNVLENTTRKN
jgi:hypothetical protein